jgi:hypothetical protein
MASRKGKERQHRKSGASARRHDPAQDQARLNKSCESQAQAAPPTNDMPDIPDFLRRNPGDSLMSPEVNPSTSLTLDDLAARIKAEHEATALSLKRGIEHAIKAGELLIQAKAQLDHGSWLPWLKEHCAMRPRMAQNYMQIARRRGELESNAQSIAHLTLPKALQALAVPRLGAISVGPPLSPTSEPQIDSPPPSVSITSMEAVTTRPESKAAVVENEGSKARKLPGAKPQSLLLRSNSVEHYTPARFIEAARKVLETIDLDPASCDEANETVRALKFFDAQSDGLKQKWCGRVWLNPPYDGGVQPFIEKLMDSLASRDVTAAIVLLNSNSTDSKWFRPLWEGLLCFCYDRSSFKGHSPANGSVFVYFGPRPEAFTQEFSVFGAVVCAFTDQRRMLPISPGTAVAPEGVAELRDFAQFTIANINSGGLKLSGDSKRLRRWRDLKERVEPLVEAKQALGAAT